MAQLQDLLAKLDQSPESVTFQEAIAAIDITYDFKPTAFKNGDLQNTADQNHGSCKIIAFGQLNKLDELQTLACFGDYYRQDVLANLEGNDHQNIRNFRVTGWAGIHFDGTPLTVK